MFAPFPEERFFWAIFFSLRSYLLSENCFPSPHQCSFPFGDKGRRPSCGTMSGFPRQAFLLKKRCLHRRCSFPVPGERGHSLILISLFFGRPNALPSLTPPLPSSSTQALYPFCAELDPIRFSVRSEVKLIVDLRVHSRGSLLSSK